MSNRIGIVDFKTEETVRPGGFGYDVIFLASYLLKKGIKGEVFCDAKPEDIGGCDEYIYTLWNPKQLGMVKESIQRHGGKVVGYPFDNTLPRYDWDVREGFELQAEGIGLCDGTVFEDCDYHVKEVGDEKEVMPIHLSYGCSNNCAFCPVPKVCGRKVSVMPVDKACDLVRKVIRMGFDIHFFDDVFFREGYTEKILDVIREEGGRFLCLSSVDRLYRFARKYGVGRLRDSGMVLVEVGLESPDAGLRRKMRKTGKESWIQEIAEMAFHTFWLVITFHPGETIGTIQRAGEWLREYGFRYDRMLPRIRTNSTEGGLGQFFMPYDWREVVGKGKLLEEYPGRLQVGFIPYSFLKSKFKVVRGVIKEDMKWFKLYGVEPMDLAKGRIYRVWEVVGSKEDAVRVAIMARLGLVGAM